MLASARLSRGRRPVRVASADENAAQRLMPLASRSFLPLRNVTGDNSARGRSLQNCKKVDRQAPSIGS